ncbi:MAG: S8 family serine peptidase, partial [Ruminococcus sp.]
AGLEESIGVSGDIQVDSVENFSDKRDGFSVATVSSPKLSTEQMIDSLNKSDDVLIAEPNYICRTLSITNDTYSDFQWGLDNKGQNGGKKNADINPQDLWSKSDATTKENVVAVVDTGVDYTHEELKDKMWVNPYQNSLKGVNGLDFSGENSDLTPMDTDGHGTHCAGVIAAQNDNNIGIAGVSRNTKIMALKIFDSDGYGDLESCIAAYNYIYRAMRLGVNVVAINNSWGIEEDSKILTELIDKVGKLGAVSVCAAGNSSTDFSKETSYEDMYAMQEDYYEEYLYSKGSKSAKDAPQGYYFNYPAMSDSKYIITVAATSEDGEISDYSDYGKDTVDVAAPGTDILSSVSYNSFLPNVYTDTDSKCSAYLTKDFNATVGKLQSGDGEVTVKETAGEYFSDTTDDKTSLSVDINNVSEAEYYTVEIPYTAQPGEQNPYFSMMLKIKNLPETDEFLMMFGVINQVIISDFPADKEVTESDITSQSAYYLTMTGDDWIHIEGKLNNKDGGERKLVLTFVNYGVGNYSLLFDNIGISKGTAKEENSFGKYDYYSGTSMSAPLVTGAIALLMEKDSTLTSQKAMDKISHSLTQTDDLSEKTIYGGYVDLAKLDCPVPHIDDVKMVSNKPTISGSQLSNVTVYVDGKAVSSTYNTKTGTITINDNSLINKTTVVTVKNDWGKSSQKTVLVKGTAYTEMGISYSGFDSFSNNVSDGKNIYVLSGDGTVTKYTPNSKNILSSSKSYDTRKNLKEHFKNYINGSPYKIEAYSPVYSGGYIYFVVDCNLTTAGADYGYGAVYASQSALVKMSVSSGKMSYTAVSSSLHHPTVAVYNDTPYLVGGYDTNTNSLSKTMYKYSSGKWSKVSTLPSARAYGECVQVGTKLVYTMG